MCRFLSLSKVIVRKTNFVRSMYSSTPSTSTRVLKHSGSDAPGVMLEYPPRGWRVLKWGYYCSSRTSRSRGIEVLRLLILQTSVIPFRSKLGACQELYRVHLLTECNKSGYTAVVAVRPTPQAVKSSRITPQLLTSVCLISPLSNRWRAKKPKDVPSPTMNWTRVPKCVR